MLFSKESSVRGGSDSLTLEFRLSKIFELELEEKKANSIPMRVGDDPAVAETRCWVS